MQDLTLILEGGALTGMNYISKQPKRSAKINIEYCDNPRYIGRKALRIEKGLIGYDYLFNEISKKDYPFDYEAFKLSNQKFISVITNCEKGITEYVEKNDCKEDIFKQGRIMVIAPKLPVTVSRLEKNKDKLQDLYKEGIKDAEIYISRIIEIW